MTWYRVVEETPILIVNKAVLLFCTSKNMVAARVVHQSLAEKQLSWTGLAKLFVPNSKLVLTGVLPK